MSFLVEQAVKIFLNHLIVPIVAGLVCGFFVSRQAKKNFTRRQFLDRLNFSLNIIKNGQLRIRTLIEKPSSDVFLNPVIFRIVQKAARETTEDDSLLPIKSLNDYWFCLNSLLNEVSEEFSDGFLRMDIDSSVQSETYILCITCEVAENMKTRKIRAMILKKSLLENFPATDPEVESPTHTTRIRTLRQIEQAYNSGERNHCFIQFELCV